MYRFLVGKIEGKRPLGSPRRRWVNNNRIDMLGEGVYWVLVGKPYGKRALGRPGRRMVYNFRIDVWVHGSV